MSVGMDQVSIFVEFHFTEIQNICSVNSVEFCQRSSRLQYSAFGPQRGLESPNICERP